MSFLDELRDKRRKFLDGLEANREDIKLDIFKDFYPDKAHFIYERNCSPGIGSSIKNP